MLNKYRQGRRGEKICTVTPVICGSSARNLLHVTFLAFRILKWLLDF